MKFHLKTNTIAKDGYRRTDDVRLFSRVAVDVCLWPHGSN
jgi:hypothetical protein